MWLELKTYKTTAVCEANAIRLLGSATLAAVLKKPNNIWPYILPMGQYTNA